MDAAAFLERQPTPWHPVVVIYGKEVFWRRLCRDALARAILGFPPSGPLPNADIDDAIACATTSLSADSLDFSALRAELSTLPFLATRRIVILEAADDFISRHREALEAYLSRPSSVGVLILEPDSFPGTTRLAKALPDTAKIECIPLNPYKPQEAESWAVRWCIRRYQKTLSGEAAGLLVERVGLSLGLLDQELSKLSLAIGPRKSIEPEDVQQYVGRSRAGNVFGILDAIGEGRAAEAFSVLQELFEEGEEPLAILGALTAQLRKLALVGRLVQEGQALGPAMDLAGVAKWPAARQATERQLKQLGRVRVGRLADELVAINLGLKGGNPLPPRWQLERFLVELARPKPVTSSSSPG
jgi:DNA polymerase-3 subunit delta